MAGGATRGMSWQAAGAQERFLHVLRAAGVNVQVRRRKGARIDAACGQLRRLAAQGEPTLAAPPSL